MSETVEAEVVQAANLAKAPAPAVSYTLPTVTVGNLDAVEGFVEAVEAFFDGCEIDPTDKDQVKALKGLRADVNRAANAIDGKRRDMDRAIKGATAEADGALDALRDRLRAVYAKTGVQIEEADRIWRERRLGMLASEYQGIAPDLTPLIGLGSFIAAEKRLVQKSTSDAKACSMLDDMVARAVSERETLSKLDVAHPVEADKVYCETLSLKAALDESERIEREAAERREHAERMRDLEQAVAERRRNDFFGDSGDPSQWETAPEPEREWTLTISTTRSKMERVVEMARGMHVECEVE